MITTSEHSLETQTSLLDAAMRWLSQQLPASWAVKRTPRLVASADGTFHESEGELEIQAPFGPYRTISVETRASVGPHDVELLLPAVHSLRALGGDTPLLLVAPRLSPRMQELLAQEQINYLDLAGNARVRLDSPAIFISHEALHQSEPSQPMPAGGGAQDVRGWRVLRTLIDVRPPHGVRELTSDTGLTIGFVTRLLNSLDQDQLIRRGPTGDTRQVDVPALLRAWAESYDLFGRDQALAYVAPADPRAVLGVLPTADPGAIVTGSYAAARIVPDAGDPEILTVLCHEPARIATAAGLRPAMGGANVMLVVPPDDAAFDRAVSADGVRWAAPAQVALDCLAGTSRMREEGEALLAWLTAHEDEWRAPASNAGATGTS